MSEKTDPKRRAALRLIGASALAGALTGVKPALADDWKVSGKDAFAAIHTRRSHRAFTGGPIPDADLQAILYAGMSAPSTHNCQPWEFVVLKPGGSLERIIRAVPRTEYLNKAGAVLVCCVNMDFEWPKEALLCSMACCNMNILLSAAAMGYGAVWIEITPDEERVEACREVLRLPEKILPLNLIPLGVPSAAIPPENRYKPERIHYDTW